MAERKRDWIVFWESFAIIFPLNIPGGGVTRYGRGVL